jgi:hypothetical protein
LSKVESCIQPFVDRWETTDANAVATDYEEADKIIDWMNRKKPVVIVADGRFWKLDNPHFVATVLRSWEVE